MKIQYLSDDGRTFPTEKECREHEEGVWRKLIFGLKTPEALDRALKGEDQPLSDALEKAGNMCAEARRARGDLRRKPRGITAAAATENAAAAHAAHEAANKGQALHDEITHAGEFHLSEIADEVKARGGDPNDAHAVMAAIARLRARREAA